MQERKGVVTFQGEPLTLLGDEVTVGQAAPDFTVVDKDFKPVKLSEFAGRVVLISAVPSLDTPVCSIQTKRFNEEAAKLAEKITVLTISEDLPFAQGRFCSSEKIEGHQVLSDHVYRQFGQNYGLLIKDMMLLARTVLIVGKDGVISYREIVSEITEEPNYDAALTAAKEISKIK
ncbi:MAG: thiol peroxidase [Actinobacteria bacterium]|nr:thiol peroxidase [Actinomycetota bacterium]